MNKNFLKQIKNYKFDRLFIILFALGILLVFNISLIVINFISKQNEKEIMEEKIQVLAKKKEVEESIQYGDIIYLGDSITEFYKLDNYYKIPIVNSGTSGFTTDDILLDLDNKVFKYNPKKIVILIGTNDINIGKTSDYIVNNIKKIVDLILEKRPNVTIYIQSLYPINNIDDSKVNHGMVGIRNNEFIQEINKKLKKYCDLNEFEYIDMYNKLLDDDGNLNMNYTVDGLHISDEGYNIITKELHKYII